MKILFVGLGSIGQRHLQNFKEIYGDLHHIFHLKSSANNLFIENGKAYEVDNLAKKYEINEINELSKALELSPDVVFITNPSSLHLDIAIKFAEIGASLFIEKPLSSSLERVDVLKEIIKKKSLICMLGYQTRFHPLLKELKLLMNDKEFGDIISAQLEWGTYLPDHHKYEDYKNSYAARSDLGGGVLLSLIHEVDLLLYLFGSPKDVFAVESSVSNLEIQEDDTVFSLFSFNKSNKNFPVSLSLSFSQIYETRSIKICFQKSVIIFDLVKNSLKIYNNKGLILEKTTEKEFTRNTMFLDELKYFMNCIKINKIDELSIDDGIESLKIVSKIKDKLHKNV